jgi:SAM-dependent methyltransferase
MLFIASFALTLSGAGCLIAQVAIQKYAQVVFGGLNVVTMYLISFSFIAGLATGSLFSGLVLCRASNTARSWAIVEFLNAVLTVPFIPFFSLLVVTTFPIGKAAYLLNPALYYVYALIVIALTTFILATAMGLNYPLAFETLRRRGIVPYRAALVVLASNTIGAAIGAVVAVALMPYVSMVILIFVSTIGYVLSGSVIILAKGRLATGEKRALEQKRRAVLMVQRAAILLFASGFAGFAYETVMFRHFSMAAPYRYEVFGLVLALFLLFWGIGAALRSIIPLPSRYVLIPFGASLSFVWTYLLTGENAHLLNIVDWSGDRPQYLVAFLVPALMSGWYYTAVHSEIGDGLSSGNVATLYTANLSGAFVGGLTAGIALPSLASFIYVVPIAIGVLIIALAVEGRAILFMATATAGAAAIAVPFFGSNVSPSLRYYRDFNYSQGIVNDVAEDWAGAAWVMIKDGRRRHFFVNGRIESPDFQDKYGGLRLPQVESILAAKHNRDIMVIGLGLGISIGDIASKLPDSHIVAVDYSPAVIRLASSLGTFNSNVASASNVEIVAADGRMTLQVERRKFDIIMQMASADGVPGTSTIKSMEFMRIVKNRLRPDGFYLAIGNSLCTMRAAQAVFQNIYLQFGFLAASDAPIETLVDVGKLAPFGKQLAAPAIADWSPDMMYTTIRVPDLEPGRMTTDTDPCSDFPTSGQLPHIGTDKPVLIWPAMLQAK